MYKNLGVISQRCTTSPYVSRTVPYLNDTAPPPSVYLQLYPDEGHRLAAVREHLYRTTDQFLHECLLPDNVHELVAEVI